MKPDTTPPAAKRVIAIDFDDTIAPWGPLFDLDPPFPGVAEALSQADRAGYRIFILTSRLSPRWWRDDYAKFGYSHPEIFGYENRRYVESYLQYWNIPYFEVTAEKVPAEIYLDDKGQRVRPGTLADVLTEHVAREVYCNGH